MPKLFMRRLSVLLLIPVALVSTMALASKPDMRFRIETTRQLYHAGAPVVLAWTLTNQSSRTLRVLESMDMPGRSDFDPISLTLGRTDASGVSSTSVIYLMGKRTAVQRVLRELPPGGRVSRSFDLSMFAAMAGRPLEPGRYTLSARYDLGRTGILSQAEQAAAFTEAVSAPTIAFTVTQP